jgi:hypothetical protein
MISTTAGRTVSSFFIFEPPGRRAVPGGEGEHPGIAHGPLGDTDLNR